MKVIKGFSSLMIFILVFTLNVDKLTASENQVIKIATKQIEEMSPEWEIHVAYPAVSGLNDKKFEERLNNKIKKQIDETILNVKKEGEKVPGFPYLLYVTYRVEEDGNFYSVLIKTEISKGNNFSSTVTGYNFDTKTNRLYTIGDIYDVSKVNSFIKEEISKHPDKYFTGDNAFHTINKNQPFYIKNKKLTIIFNKYQIAAGLYGTPEISIDLKKLK